MFSKHVGNDWRFDWGGERKARRKIRRKVCASRVDFMSRLKLKPRHIRLLNAIRQRDPKRQKSRPFAKDSG